ncbi:MAG: hypothetical protein ACSHWW_00470 [Nonlabens sp.]|uniref:hypothetical protein n=1 Tax=Nonlabens sp. TaxID=1888209 RepID=UPI003EF74929
MTGTQLTENRSLNKALRKAKASLGINAAQKSVYDSINGFWIDDSKVNHLTSGDYESFTFGIYSSLDSLSIQNLVFHKQKDSTYLPIVLSYDLNQIDSTQSTIKYRILDSSFILDNIGKNDAGGLLDINPCGWDTSDCLCWRIVGYEGGNPITQLEVQNDCSWQADQDETIDAGDTGGGDGGANTDGSGSNDGNGTAGGWTSGGGGDASGSNNIDDNNDPCDDQLTLSDDSCSGVISSPISGIEFEERSNLFGSLILSDRIYLSNNPELEEMLLENLDFEDDSELDKEVAKVAIDLAKAFDGEGTTTEIDPSEIIQKLQQAVAEGITSTAEAAHKLYLVLTKLEDLYPGATSDINTFVINPIRISMLQLTQTSVDQMEWMDLLLVWTFELGGNYDGMVNTSDFNPNNDAVLINIHGIDKPLISGDGTNDPNKNVKDLSEPFDVNQIPDSQQGSVNAVRQLALQSIQNNQIPAPPIQSSFSSTFSYGQNEFYDGISNLNVATAFLGSYTVSTVVTNNMDGTYDISFELSNTTGWESGTRFRKDGPDNNLQHDAVISNKPRGSGINMGGNIKQNFQWTETYP